MSKLNSTLTVERLRELLNYEPATGIFTRKIKTNRNKAIGSVAGTTWKSRITIGIDNDIYLAHRLAWMYVYGKWPDGVIDHINGNPMDNRLVNLRDVSQAVNRQNMTKAMSNSKSGILGVHWAKHIGKWCANIRTNRRSRNLGYFDTPEEAQAVYVREKRIIHVGNTL